MTPPEMSDSHKEALAEGRRQGRAVKTYLQALDENKPRRGRKRTPESIGNRLAKIETEMSDSDPLKRLQLTQERIDLQAELDQLGNEVDLASFEADFVAVAKAYAERKGISYAAFRELGVSAATLKKAGISRAGG